MQRLGFSAAAVRGVNPRCIYISMPGFRSSDHARAELKAYEAIIMTESGVFADMVITILKYVYVRESSESERCACACV